MLEHLRCDDAVDALVLQGDIFAIPKHVRLCITAVWKIHSDVFPNALYEQRPIGHISTPYVKQISLKSVEIMPKRRKYRTPGTSDVKRRWLIKWIEERMMFRSHDVGVAEAAFNEQPRALSARL